MKSFLKAFSIALLVFVLSVPALARPKIVDLGPVAERDTLGTRQQHIVIDEKGRVFADQVVDGQHVPSVYRQGQWQPISPDLSNATLWAVNRHGDCVGFNWSTFHGFIYFDGMVIDLASSPFTVPSSITDSGFVTGWGQEKTYNDPVRPFVFHPTFGIKFLKVSEGNGTPETINERGQIAGGLTTAPSGVVQSFLTDRRGNVTVLGSGSCYDINSKGTVVGEGRDANNIFGAFRRLPNHPVENLGTLDPDSYNQMALAINERGQIVGLSGERAFRWSKGTGMVDLNSILPAGSQWVLSRAHDINDKGWIVGTGTINSEKHYFLLKP